MFRVILGKITRNAIISLFVFGCAFVFADSKKITILHTNDHHGQFLPDKSGNFGLVNRAIIIEKIKNEVESTGGTVLLLDAGDINTGRPESDLLEGLPDILGMNIIGYDVMTVGNHEFDIPLDALRKLELSANFPFISANIYKIKDDKRLFKPYTVIEKNGLKVGIVGLTTVSTKTPTSKRLIDYDFREHSSEFMKALSEMKKENSSLDLVIGLTHIGYYQNALHGSNPPGDVSLAKSLSSGSIDIIVGGHSHTAICYNHGQLMVDDYSNCMPDRVNDIWITQALSSGQFIGRIDVTLNDTDLILDRYQLIPILKQDTSVVSESVEYLSSILFEFKAETEKLLNRPIAQLPMELNGDRGHVRFEQAEIAKVILKAQAQRVEASFSVMGGGSIRASLNKGSLTYADILAVQPFGNHVTYVDLDHNEVMNYINGVAKIASGSGGYPQFFNVTFDKTDDGISNIKIAGENLKSDRLYRLSLPDYNAGGGNDYPIVSSHPRFVDSGYIDAEVLASYLTETYPHK